MIRKIGDNREWIGLKADVFSIKLDQRTDHGL